METKQICPECGSNMYHNKGISKKTGKPYENYKCGECKYIQWVDVADMGSPQKTMVDGNAILLEEMQAGFKDLEKRFDGLNEWCSQVTIILKEISKK